MRALITHADNILAGIPKHRLLALDALRGITICAMILVNNPGSWSYMYAPLKHAAWHGYTPTDLIFPFFIFMVGMALSLSIPLMQKKGFSHQAIIKSSATRMLKLIGLGLFLALFYYNFRIDNYDWVEQKLLSIRWLGVLQRIGIVYFISVLIVLYCRPKHLVSISVGLLAFYAAAMMLIPYPDAQDAIYQGLWAEGNNLSAYIDHHLLGNAHVYKSATTPFSYDPEGLFSTLPAIATCLFGVLTGKLVQDSSSSLIQRCQKLIGWGLVAIAAGYLLTLVIPVNKALWTPSFVLIAQGFASLTLCVCLYLLDIKGIKRWCTPFLVFGANSILFFMFAGVVGRIVIMIPTADTTLKGFLFQDVFQPLFGNFNGSLAYGIAFLCVSYFVMWQCYKRNFFWKV